MASSVSLEGPALHSGAFGRVTLKSYEGPLVIDGYPLDAWRAIRAERSTRIEAGAGPSADLFPNGVAARHGDPRGLAEISNQVAPKSNLVPQKRTLRTVEHLFAALAGLHIRTGLSISVDGDELPLLDGTAALWTDALATLSVAPTPPRLRVVRHGEVDVARSRYVFAPDDDATHVSVTLDFGDARLAPSASWEGDVASFFHIARARTFCFSAEIEEISRAGLASHVTPESVIVIGEQILAFGRPFTSDEPARHKLLDLIGDLFLYGGPPRGRIEVSRPGHWSTHQALCAAIAQGLVIVDG